MPNWVFNTMSVTGTEDAVERFARDMSKPIPTFKPDPEDKWRHIDGEWEMDEDVIFSFWNVVSPENLEEYFTGETWYNWNIANWGTKWDSKLDSEKSGEVDRGAGYISYHFDTAWSAPYGIFMALGKKYPELEFDIHWEEEQGFGAELIVKGEELTTTREWDIPSSHADYLERDMEFSCICAYEDEPENMYEDCPKRNIVPTARAVQIFEEATQAI